MEVSCETWIPRLWLALYGFWFEVAARTTASRMTWTRPDWTTPIGRRAHMRLAHKAQYFDRSHERAPAAQRRLRGRGLSQRQALPGAQRHDLTLIRAVRSLWFNLPAFPACARTRKPDIGGRVIPPSESWGTSRSSAPGRAPLVPALMPTQSCLGCSLHRGPHHARSHLLCRLQA